MMQNKEYLICRFFSNFQIPFVFLGFECEAMPLKQNERSNGRRRKVLVFPRMSSRTSQRRRHVELPLINVLIPLT